ALRPDEVPVSPGLHPYFVGMVSQLVEELKEKIRDAADGKQEVTIDGIDFRRAYNKPQYVWAFSEDDVPKVAMMMDWELRAEEGSLTPLHPEEISVVDHSLKPYFVGDPHKLEENLKQRIKKTPLSKEGEIVIDDVHFRRASSGTRRVWAFAAEKV